MLGQGICQPNTQTCVFVPTLICIGLILDRRLCGRKCRKGHVKGAADAV